MLSKQLVGVRTCGGVLKRVSRSFHGFRKSVPKSEHEEVGEINKWELGVGESDSYG